MTYPEALTRTLKLQEYAAEFNHNDIQYIVVPADYNEMQIFLSDYDNPVNQHKKIDCRDYCSDGNFSVYRIDANTQNKKGIKIK